MKKILIFGSPFVVFIAMSWFLLQGLYRDPQLLPSAKIGKPLPEFSLPALSNLKSTLTQASFREGPALLNVWATWCPSCRVEHPALNKLAKEGVIIYGRACRDERRSKSCWKYK